MPDDLALTARDVIGANLPPDPLGAHKANIADLYDEAKNWLDGAEIESEAQAVAVDRLIDDFKAAIEAAKASETEQTKPLLDEIEAVRESYRPLIGDTKKVTGTAIRAKTLLLALKSRWARKLEAERAAEAEALRQQAAAEAKAAAEAARSAVTAGDLGAAESAEDMIRGAQATLRAARQAEKPPVKGMRDNWVIKGFAAVEADGKQVDGRVALLRHYFQTAPDRLVEACLEIAREDVRLGKRTIPGLVIENERRAV